MSECQHPQVAERRRRKSNGAVVITPQCLICGWAAPEVSKQGRVLAKLEWFDESIAVRWAEQAQREAQLRYEERQRQWQENYKNRSGEWWEAYKAYLQSDHWKHTREAVLERNPICRKCWSRPATEAHHWSYETFNKYGFSLDIECVGVCHSCHAELTEASRERCTS